MKPDLRSIDDSREGVHIVHAQIGDGESPPAHLIRLQLALLCLQHPYYRLREALGFRL